MKSYIFTYAPTVQVKPTELNKMISFIYSHAPVLFKWGALKIEQDDECRHTLKNRRKPTYSIVKRQILTDIDNTKGIFLLHTVPCGSAVTSSKSSPKDECEFWKSVCQTFNEENEQPSISTYSGKSFYFKQGHHDGFNMHQIPDQSLLQIGGKQITNRFAPTLIQTYGAGAIFPLSTACQGLLSLHYLHEGATRYWYIIPANERSALEKVLTEKNLSICFSHQSFVFDPEFLDANGIRYSRIIQDPGQFVVLEAGTLAQSYCMGASWNETIDFALPSWLEYHRAQSHAMLCTCNTNHFRILSATDVALFGSEQVDQYVATHLRCGVDNNGSSSKGQNIAIPFLYYRFV